MCGDVIRLADQRLVCWAGGDHPPGGRFHRWTWRWPARCWLGRPSQPRCAGGSIPAGRTAPGPDRSGAGSRSGSAHAGRCQHQSPANQSSPSLRRWRQAAWQHPGLAPSRTGITAGLPHDADAPQSASGRRGSSRATTRRVTPTWGAGGAAGSARAAAASMHRPASGSGRAGRPARTAIVTVAAAGLWRPAGALLRKEVL